MGAIFTEAAGNNNGEIFSHKLLQSFMIKEMKSNRDKDINHLIRFS